MNELITIVKFWLVPGSVGFLLGAVTLGLALLSGPPAIQRWGRRWIGLVVLTYWLLATPAIALSLERSLIARNEPPGPALSRVRTIVVLGSGSFSARAPGGEMHLLNLQSAFSAIEARRLYGVLKDPIVVVSGGAPAPELQLRSEADVLKDALVAAGIPSARIVVERDSLDTHDQAVHVSAWLRERKIRDFALIASQTHMPRAAALFRAQDVEPVESPSLIRSEGVSGWADRSRPSLLALEASTTVMYHYLATSRAWWSGWLEKPGDTAPGATAPGL